MKKILLLLCCLAAPAFANPMPSEVSTAIPNAQKVGTGTLGFLWYDAYRATLWAAALQWNAAAPFALSITYGMEFSTADLVDRTLEEMKRSGTQVDINNYRADLEKSFPPVADGQTITAIFTPPATTNFYHNGALTHSVNNAEFASLFFNIWLGENTSEPSLRRALLNSNNE